MLGLVIALARLLDLTRLQALHAYLDAPHAAAHFGADELKVGQKAANADAGDLKTDTAGLLGIPLLAIWLPARGFF